MNKPYICAYPDCGKAFMSKGHLKNHSEIHLAVRKFTCHYEGCNESYARF